MKQPGMCQTVQQTFREQMVRDAGAFVVRGGVGVSIHDNPMLRNAWLLKEFAPTRVMNIPVSEAAIGGIV